MRDPATSESGSEPLNHRPISGATADGRPLSFNRAPARDLEPWVGRVMVAMTAAPADAEASGLLCNDAAYLRLAAVGQWQVETRDGSVPIRDRTFLTGQHVHCMKLDYRGPIRVVGFMLRPGAIRAIWGRSDADFVQRLVPLSELGLDEAAPLATYSPDIDGEQWLAAMEDWLRRLIARSDARPPDPVSQAFELVAFADPNRPLTEVCAELGIMARSLQRRIGRDFGLPPKQVLRRARVLDLASRLCGVADQEEEDILLRFFDQSHLIREFQAFFGMTPTAFRMRRNALLTLSLEIRQARRLELLNRLSPGAVRPWMQTPFQPLPTGQGASGAVSRTAS